MGTAGDVKVVHSPAYCGGHIALLFEKVGVLIAGTVCSNVMNLGYSAFSEDIALA